MKKLLFAFLLFTPASAWAMCPTPLTIKDASATTQNISTTDDGSGNCQSNVAGLAGAMVDGWNATEGAKADSAYAGSGSASIVAILKGVYSALASSLPLPTGAATAANQEVTAAGTSATSAQGVQGVTGGVALPISAASLPLPTGGATSANQSTEITSLATIATNTGASVPAGTATIGKIDILGNAGAIMDFGGQNAASPANALLGGCQFNTSPTTITSGNVSPVQCNSAGSLNVAITSGGGSGGTASSFAAAFPATGTAIGVKNGSNMVNLTADGSNNLDVNCVVGCSGGTASNASSAVATSSTNGTTNSWLYAFNGTTWDQLQDDGSKNLKVNIATAIAAGTNLMGKVGIDQTTVGTTNGVSLAQVGANTVSTGAGATGTGTQRVGVAQDTTTIAGSAPGTAGTASANVVTVQGISSMTKLLVTPDSVALPANQSVNVAQVNGVTTLTGTGAQGTGAQRVTVATDTATVAGSASIPAGTNLMGKVGIDQTTVGTTNGVSLAQIGATTVATGTGAQGAGAQRVTVATDTATVAGSASLPAGTNLIGKAGIDQTTVGTTNGVSLAQIGANTILTGNGVSGTGSQRVNIASDNTAIANAGQGATGSAVPSGATYAGAVSSGNLTGMIQADNSAAINVSTATTTQIVALTSGKKVYVTSFDVIAAGTGNIQFEYGTGTACATGTTALTGNYNLTAQTGLTKGTGLGPVLVVPSGNALCVLTSAAVGMAGSVSYTQF